MFSLLRNEVHGASQSHSSQQCIHREHGCCSLVITFHILVPKAPVSSSEVSLIEHRSKT